MTQEVLKLALEFLEDNQHYVADNENHFYVVMYNNAIEKCKEALAQLEQEPVAWSISPAVKGEDGRLYAYTNEKEWALSLVSKGHEIRPLVHGDTTPSQRTWVGLTDEEIKTICLENGWDSSWQSLRFAQAIEAKLKDKNS